MCVGVKGVKQVEHILTAGLLAGIRDRGTRAGLVPLRWSVRFSAGLDIRGTPTKPGGVEADAVCRAWAGLLHLHQSGPQVWSAAGPGWRLNITDLTSADTIEQQQEDSASPQDNALLREQTTGQWRSDPALGAVLQAALVNTHGPVDRALLVHDVAQAVYQHTGPDGPGERNTSVEERAGLGEVLAATIIHRDTMLYIRAEQH